MRGVSSNAEPADDWELDPVDGSRHLHDVRNVRSVAQLGLSRSPGQKGRRTLRLRISAPVSVSGTSESGG
jgi:hypothetical protein